ncbi:MAG: S-layer homology domain-containing protein [Oscillospiraceae bacterium]|nr:S-layer homology domain-containing protein [Oscillospiraceae bacterium]
MKKLIKRVVLLALAVLAVVLIHNQVRKEAEEAAANAALAAEQLAAESEDDTQSMAIIRLGDGVTLGRMEENAEGGVNVIVSREGEPEETYTFTDVAYDSWYANAVNFAVSTGLMTGEGNEPIFHPEFGMLRESFASILYRFTNGVPVTPRERFEDVPADSWYFDAVAWVTNRGLMTEIDPGVFGAGEYMTCEQALVGLYRVAGEPVTDGSLLNYPYASKVSDYGRAAIDWAWKSGLIAEDECVWYPPQAISRAQVALLLMRYSAMAS